MAADTDIRKFSVTRDDVGSASGAPVFHWMLNAMPGATGMPAWWSPARDYYLRDALYTPFHDFWAGAIGIAITKMASQSWEIEGDAPRLRNFAQQLLLSADNNQSWVAFLGRHLQDYLCTDNGAFVEIVRASSAAGSRILGLMHLDSLRVTRTGDPDIPAIYRDTKGIDHQVEAHQILMLADMPSSAETWHGVGLCAASRAWGAILKMESIERYIYEKVSGKRPLAVDLVNGINYEQMRSSVQTAKEDSAAQKTVTYMGAVIVPTISDTPISHTRINFAELPDGFDRKQEFDIAVLAYANAIGLDVQDLQPLTGQPLGTGAQSQVLHDKAQGKGLAAWRQQITHLFNQFVFSDAVTFAFSENDLRDKQQKATISLDRANAISTLVEKGLITGAQGVQVLADEGELPKEFVPVDQTPEGTITDADQPQSEADLQAAQMQQEQGAAPDMNAAIKEAQGDDKPAPFRIEVYRERFKQLSERFV